MNLWISVLDQARGEYVTHIVTAIGLEVGDVWTACDRKYEKPLLYTKRPDGPVCSECSTAAG